LAIKLKTSSAAGQSSSYLAPTINCNKASTTVSASILVLAVPSKIYIIDEPWTIEKLKDELITCLSTAATYNLVYDPVALENPALKNMIIYQHIEFVYKYHNAASLLMHRMLLYKGDAPEFVIHLSDLPQKIKKELADLKRHNSREFKRIISETIDRLCEIANYEYFHRSAYNYPKKWRFEE
jgi:hypothetical protein